MAPMTLLEFPGQPMVHNLDKIQRRLVLGPLYAGHGCWPQLRSTPKCVDSTMKPKGCSNSKRDIEAMGLRRPGGRNTGLQGNHYITYNI